VIADVIETLKETERVLAVPLAAVRRRANFAGRRHRAACPCNTTRDHGTTCAQAAAALREGAESDFRCAEASMGEAAGREVDEPRRDSGSKQDAIRFPILDAAMMVPV
jgi:hypothetical protein